MARLEAANLAALKELEGRALPKGEWITITQEMINSFADATLDHQWIHVDVERAKKESPFKTPIAHGFMSVSMVSAMLYEVFRMENTSMLINYGLNRVRFPHPVAAGKRLRLVASIGRVEPYADNGVKVFWDCCVEIEDVEKPACVCEFIALLFE